MVRVVAIPDLKPLAYLVIIELLDLECLQSLRVDRMVRTIYELEEHDEYVAANDLLVRRAAAWARLNDRPFDQGAARIFLDSRHYSFNGRLGYWTPDEVHRALLQPAPLTVSALGAAPETSEVPKALKAETLRTLLGFMAARDLLDPRGASLAENERAIDEAAAANEVPHTISVFQERTLPQLPVWLPAAAELAKDAEQSKLVNGLRDLVRWLGPEGKSLTQSGNIRPADARELAALLETGEQEKEFRSAAELNGLTLIVTWAKKARLIRKQGSRLVPVAKSLPLLDDIDALWQRAFEAAFDLGEAAVPPWFVNEPPSPVAQLYAEIAPDVLNTIYSLPEPAPVSRMVEPVWENILECFGLDSLPPAQLTGFRHRVDSEVNQILNVFEYLGAVTSTHGIADKSFTEDLDADGPFAPNQALLLRERLKEPDRLVALTPLGTRSMRQRLLAEGRDVPLVGELTDATAAQLLGIVSESYPNEAGADEIARWRSAHGGSLEPLLAAIRTCPFVNRRTALLATLAHATPEGEDLLTDLLTDSELGPVAILALRDDLIPEQVSDDEVLWLTAGGLLQLFEVGGAAMLSASLNQMPRAARDDIIRAVLESGFPAPETMAEFRTLVAEPLMRGHGVRDRGRGVPDRGPDRTIRHQRRRQSKRHRR